MAYQKKPKKVITEKDVEGVIFKATNGYIVRNMGETKRITRVNDIKFIDNIDIEKHNKEFLDSIRQKMNNYGEDGYNEFGFNEDGMHRNGTEFSDEGYNADGWVIIDKFRFNRNMEKEKLGTTTLTNNIFTGSQLDLDGYDKFGFSIDGYNREGFDRDGYDREGFNKQNFNREGINRETKTQYAPNGFNEQEIDEEGFNKEGINKKGKTREDVDEQRKQQRKNFLGLHALARGYANGEITIEEYLKNHKITLEELIDFAKKQKMDKNTVIGLYRKKSEYNQHKKMFNKAKYFKEKTTINGVEITEDMVDQVLQYLKDNNRLLSNKIVNEHIIMLANGELDLEEKDEQGQEATTPFVNESGENRSQENTQLPIATDIKGRIEKLGVVARDVQNTQTELKTNAIEIENPEQLKKQNQKEAQN